MAGGVNGVSGHPAHIPAVAAQETEQDSVTHRPLIMVACFVLALMHKWTTVTTSVVLVREATPFIYTVENHMI